MAIAHSNMDADYKNTKKIKDSKDKSLDFYESLYHFKKMFPKIDADIIECVLRGNNGSVDKTIDYLLSMSTIDVESNETVCIKSDIIDDLPPSYNDLPKSIRDGYLSRCESVSSDNSVTNQKCSMTETNVKHTHSVNSLLNSALIGNLPNDFLRIQLTDQQFKNMNSSYLDNASFDTISNRSLFDDDDLRSLPGNYLSRRYSELTCTDSEFTDEYLAIMLQNEEFLNQLKKDDDFMNTLNEESNHQKYLQTIYSSSSSSSSSHGNHNNSNTHSKTSLDYSPHEDADYSYGDDNMNLPNPLSYVNNDEFKWKLNRMGKVSKAKLANLARVFSKRIKGGRYKVNNKNSFNNPNDYIIE